MDTTAVREALDQLDRIADSPPMDNDAEHIHGAVRAVRRAIDEDEQDDAQTTIDTAEDALAEILGVATAMQRTGTMVPEQPERLIAMVRVALADLHARPQGSVELTTDGGPAWRRLQYIDRALRWAEIRMTDRDLLDLARDLEAYAAGSPGADHE